jgi:hypothetical protein
VDQNISSYDISGRFIEACDCYSLCPCWVDDEPDEAHCTGLVAWTVTGEIDGVDIEDRHVVAVTGHGGGRRADRAISVLFVDARASRAELVKLGAAFSGSSAGGPVAGPLGELAAVTGEVVCAPIAAVITITCESDDRWRVCVDGAEDPALVEVTGRPLTFDEKPLPLTLDRTALHRELSIDGPVTAHRSDSLRVVLPVLPGGYIEVAARSGMVGRFGYQHAAGATVTPAGR